MWHMKGENMNHPIHCQNTECGKPLNFRRPSEKGRKKFCSVQCHGKAKHGPVFEHIGQVTRDRIEDIRWIAGSDHPESIAQRVGFNSFETMYRTLGRAGEHQLAQRLRNEHAIYMAPLEQSA